MLKTSLTVIILTKNESKHLQRAIDSVSGIACNIVVVDSGSSDDTKAIALQNNAKFLHNDWLNYAHQFNFALKNLPEDTVWVMRLDADEIVSPELRSSIEGNLDNLSGKINAISVGRRIAFLRKPIRWGGLFPISVVRIFRINHGRCENRWMDEHIIFDGDSIKVSGEILDDNLNSLSWWIEKHNWYSSREVIDLLNLEYGFTNFETIAKANDKDQASTKRWIKEKIYARMPIGSRALIYFIYRYFIRLGFLDGPSGTAFHFLQGFWYRYLVDIKLRETKNYMKTENVSAIVAINDVLGIKVD